MTSDGFERASDFRPLPGEANFPPPLAGIEVVGGMHIAPECITAHEGKLLMAVWPNGLPRHETTRVARFPHGLMRFGETISDCATRLLGDQFGLQVDSVELLEMDSYVDDEGHWHLEPLLLLMASGEPKLRPEIERFVSFTGTQLPQDAVWSPDWSRVWDTHLAHRNLDQTLPRQKT